MDIKNEYKVDSESPTDEINRTVAWLLLIRTTKGFEDIIEDEVQSGEKNFRSAYLLLHTEFNRVTTSPT